MLFFLQTISTIGTTFMGIFFPIFLTQILHLETSQMALIFTSALGSGIVFEFLGGKLADKYGYIIIVKMGFLFEFLALSGLTLISLYPEFGTVEACIVISILLGVSLMHWPAYYGILGNLSKTQSGIFDKLNVVWKWGALVGAGLYFFEGLSLGPLIFVIDLITSAIFIAYISLKMKPFDKDLSKTAELDPTEKTKRNGIRSLLLIPVPIALVGIIQSLSGSLDGQLESFVPIFWSTMNMFPSDYVALIIAIESSVTIVFQNKLSAFCKGASLPFLIFIGGAFTCLGIFLRSSVPMLSILVLGSVLAGLGDMILTPRFSEYISENSKGNIASHMANFYTMQHIMSLGSPTLGLFLLTGSHPVLSWAIACGVCFALIIAAGIILKNHSNAPVSEALT